MVNVNHSPSPATFWTQANALLRNNLTFQKRNKKANIRLILFPLILCILLVLLQYVIDTQLDKPKFKCGCECPKSDICDESEKVCGVEYSDETQLVTCAIPNPTEWPPLLQLSQGKWYPAVFTTLFTAQNHSFGQIVSNNMFPSNFTMDLSDIKGSLALNVLGSESLAEDNNFIEPAFTSELPIYNLQTQCPQDNIAFPAQFQIGGGNEQEDTHTFPIEIGGRALTKEIKCANGINLWRNSSSDINDEIYKGYQSDDPEGQINDIVSAFDFLNSNEDAFNVTVWYKSTFKGSNNFGPTPLLRIPRSINLVVLTALVYEKQQKLRIMMKMHGLGDGPYWMISYGFFLALSVIYMVCFVLFGSVLGLKFFTLNDYSIQFVFYFIYVNLQISLAFLLASFFSNVKTATVTAYISVFGTGLLAGFLFQFFIQDSSFPRGWIICMELYPGFALYRGLYEFAQYAVSGSHSGTDGMRWQDLSDSSNGMKEVLIIMSAEWIVVLFVAYYIDQVLSTGTGKSPLFFLKGFQKKHLSPFKKPGFQEQGSKVLAQMDKPDVIREREKVEQLLLEPTLNHAIVCDDLKKFYPGRDGNPGKFAVKELFLAVPRGECFGMLGPNGAGKTSFISMMIGLTEPTSGAAYVEGLDIRTHMNGIYTNMGVCPQHDLLWETLTGREHLLFYGRLKNLTGSVLTQAVEESLKSLNLFHGGVADKQAGKYSGGMKRRLSVAISLIGDPKVVYMDEPSTGLDPASRKCLWNVIKLAKQDRAIILTTHSMEEAEALCDRLGVFVNGNLQCIGNPKELKARYGGTYVLTMTTSSDREKDVENMVQQLSPNANKIYRLSGTQKFELPKEDVKIANVFQAVEIAKRNFTVFAWGLADTTLEDVFIKVAREAQASDTLS
ncbi:ABC transporter A family member 7-like isoform X2 [Cicer arietinum]|uniref:ABC transporter A family member 7-like isoform X2 n=1 Tax=Cicer arietinum TaxID=3827 RepID=UPI003CC65EC5